MKLYYFRDVAIVDIETIKFKLQRQLCCLGVEKVQISNMYALVAVFKFNKSKYPKSSNENREM